MKHIFSLIIIVFSMNAFSMQLSFQTLREQGQLNFIGNHLQFVTHQARGTLLIQDCSKELVNVFRDKITKDLTSEKKDRAASVLMNGRQYYLESSTQGYRILDNFHSELNDLKNNARLECLKAQN